MIKAIIFDFGGVMLHHRSDLIPHILKQIFPENVREVNNLWKENAIALFIGKLSTKRLLKKIKKALKSDQSVEALMNQWEDHYDKEVQGVNQELLNFVEQLRKKYKVYLFTDTIDSHDAINSKKNIFQKFDRVYKSFEEGLSKHGGKEAFLNILNKINLKPEECVYIDDMEQNVEQAKHLGMKAFLYTGNEDLKKNLENLGI